jgi:hypothetical protein
MKTSDAGQGHGGKPRKIKPSLREFRVLPAREHRVKV